MAARPGGGVTVLPQASASLQPVVRAPPLPHQHWRKLAKAMSCSALSSALSSCRQRAGARASRQS